MIVPERAANLILTFPLRDYGGAVQDFYAVRAWIIRSGLSLRADIAAVLHSPHFRNEKPPSIMEGEWLNRQKVNWWRVTIDFWCANAEVVQELRSVELLKGALWLRSECYSCRQGSSVKLDSSQQSSDDCPECKHSRKFFDTDTRRCLNTDYGQLCGHYCDVPHIT